MKLDQSKKAEAKDRDAVLQQALSHARHAVRTERHPLPLTTLGHVLLEAMRYDAARRESLFKEAYEYLDEAIGIEGRASRLTIHPFSVLFGAVNFFVENGGQLSGAQTEKMRSRVAEAHSLFPSDTTLGDRAELTRKLLSR